MRNIYFIVLVILCCILLMFVDPKTVQASFQYFEDQAQWEASVSNIKHFDFTPDNMTLAGEIDDAPSRGDELGTLTLTFSRTANPDLILTDFTIDSLGYLGDSQSNPEDYDFHYSDYSSISDDWNYLTFGGPESSENDDWKVTFPEGCYAFGFYLLANDTNPNELWTVYGMDDSILGSATPPAGPPSFMGAVCDVPIGWAFFDEAFGDSGDDIAISDFYLAVPESATLGILLISGLALFRRKLR